MTCSQDHDTRDSATWYGGDTGHEFFTCDECGDTFSVVVE